MADNMLQGLVRWLRFLGFPSLIASSIEELIKLSKVEQQALFLSASRKHLQKISDNKIYLVKSHIINEQLFEIDQSYKIFNKLRFLSICSLCNTTLTRVHKEELNGKVPQRVLASFNKFMICPLCNKIYWEGGHVQRIKGKLYQMKIPI